MATDLQVRLEVTNLAGTSVLQSVNVGDTFLLRGFVEDVRSEPLGVQSAYFDVTFNNSFAQLVNGSLAFDPLYASNTSGTLASGLIDEVGAADTDNTAPTTGPGDERLLFTVQLQATASGQLVFSGDLNDNENFVSRLFSGVTVPDENIDFASATVNVNALPTISAIGDQVITEDSNTGALAFTVGDAETAAAALTFTFTSSNEGVVPHGNIVIGGSGANRTVTVTSEPDLSGVTTISLTVHDANGGQATEAFVVTVNAVNDLPSISNVADQSTPENVQEVVNFNVDDLETAPAQLVVTATSSNQTLVPNANIVIGSSTNGTRTATITPAANQHGSATITLTVTDENNGTSTETFVLTVTNAPPTAEAGGPYTVAEGGTVGLSGTGADTSSAVTLEWDLDGDGTFGETGAGALRGHETGATPVFNAASLSGPTTATVTLRAVDAENASTTDTTAVVVTNVAPTANAGGPYTVAEGSSVALSGTGTDPVDALTFSWDLDGDGTFGETGSSAARGNETGATPTYATGNQDGPATTTVTLRATDSSGASASSTAAITVTNAAPTANAGGPYTVAENSTVGLSGTGADPADPITLAWDLDGDGTFGETGAGASRGNETGTNPIFNSTGLSNGSTVTITLRVADDEGASTVSTVAITVGNVAPTANAGGPYTVAEGSTVGLSGTGADPGDNVTLVWDLDGDGTFGETGVNAGRGNETGNTPSFNASGVSGPSNATVTLRASDDEGLSSTATALVTVTNVAPTANAGGPYTVAEGGAVVLNGTGADPVDALTFSWDLDGDGTFGETGSSAARGNETGNAPTFNAGGVSGPSTATVTLRTTDSAGASSTSTAAITVTNVAPTANAGGPYTVAEGATVALNGTGADPVDAVTLSWDLDGDGAFGETGASASRGNETGATPAFNASGVSGPGTRTVTLRVTDNAGASTTSTAAIVVTNTAPVADAGGPYQVAFGQTVGLSGAGSSDPGNDTLTFAWDLDGDGTFGETGANAARGNETGSTPFFNAAGISSATTATVTLRVTDSEGASNTDTALVQVISNVAPTANAGGPYTVTENGTVGLNGTANDPGDSLTLAWDLDGDGTFGETGSNAARGNETGNTPTFNAAGLNGPTTRTVTLRATDDEGLSSTSTALVTINNAAPTANAGGPYTVAEGATVALNGTGTDPVDSVTLAWDLDGDGTFGETGSSAARGNETGNAPVFNAAGVQGATTRTVTLRVTDASGDSTTSTALVSVTNVAPTANAGGPYTVGEGATVALNGSGTDPGGSPTFTWDLDGDGTFGETGSNAARGNETGNAPIFNAAGLNGPTTRTVTLRTTDNNGASATATALVTVNNVAPTPNAGGPYTLAENATVGLTGTATDPGGDTFTLVWDLDGDGTFGETGTNAARGNETGNTPTFNSAGIDGPVNRTVTLRAVDSQGASATATAIVTVTGTNANPTISDVGNQSTNEDTATGAIGFTVGDAETAAASLTVTATSSNTTLVPNASIVLGGSGANRTVTITPAANQNGTVTITLTVNDGFGGTATDTFVLTVNAVNDAPTISDIAAQTIQQGTTSSAINFTINDIDTPLANLTVTGTSSNTSLIPNSGIAFSGSNGSRSLTLTPAAGQTGTATITVTVSDGAGGTTTDTFVVTVNSTGLPTLSIGNVTQTEGDSGTKTFVFTVSLSTASSSAVTVQFATGGGTATAGTDYVASSGTITFAAGTTSQTITITVNGDTTSEPDETFNITLSSATGANLPTGAAIGTITNDDASPTMNTVRMGDDPTSPGRQTLIVEGTNGNDSITFKRHRNSVIVYLNGVARQTVPIASIPRLVIYGYDGNDEITVPRSVKVPVFIDGGAGNDTIAGGVSHDILVGGGGADKISGRQGKDVIIGGAAADTLKGGRGEDIVIAGPTIHDTSEIDLGMIMNVWAGSGNYSTRVNALRNAVAPAPALNAASVTLDDAAVDTVLGQSSLDWYIAAISGTSADKTKRKTNESLNFT